MTHYTGPLGAQVTATGTEFTLWAPSAHEVAVNLESRTVPLTKGAQGQWYVHIPGVHEGERYSFTIDGRRTADPHARAATANGEQAVVVDVGKLLGPASRLPSFPDPGEAVIYEAHVRDLTISPDNGIGAKGKFLGLAEAGTRSSEGVPTGLDYIASLGVTHLQLLPVFDFGSVDETGDLSFGAQYNWGYDPVLYNVPEGSYATDPHDPFARLREFRALVDACHARGLRVIMDVVYNHVYDAGTNPLELVEPGTFFRMRTDGSFHDATACGNETASEHPMMRRFIVDSVVYWAETFGLDGFRFDLMGIHDVATMNAVREALDEIDPGILIIGEGWTMGNHEPGVIPADQNAGHLMPRIGMFQDTFRDVVKGSNFNLAGPGFVSGNPSYAPDSTLMDKKPAAKLLFDAMNGAPEGRNYLSAAQCVIYNEAHDNFTMFDKLRGTAGLEHAHEGEIARRHTLATSIQMLSRGIAFVHAGQELLRTKQGVENSYNAPDSINAFDYNRALTFPEQLEFFRELVAFRRRWGWVTESDYATIAATTSLMEAEGLHLCYRVAGAFDGEDALIVINADVTAWDIRRHTSAHEGWVVHVADERVFTPARPWDQQPVAPLSVLVLQRRGERGEF
ncbi:type I pullulanase [Corynebacterium sp. 153RC1]|uniref:type I pullulanase n=1 Tax=unclassified Corynebacterium TaxID=2624378 RepID=UPI00211CB857|nr:MULTISPECIES: type I pullulanase [unclassified Corynebacterium]MCQ9370078.1 type I pullulanase [Corynebacterium sp. 35RC1]MCQ9351852.1 type I pullulanase [Corynebacterium sp. 209RC1]MCQ9355009.1 type I pullulanase [Corynebacterium sp. 1222RC1]MCQ9356134.1 type I pullulanase [Corynebacterium sp. 122RC1]MCQ9359529.1 type I pullulanase [Corynebacterium sp. 142RC1]